jgi:hypothetical protein
MARGCSGELGGNLGRLLPAVVVVAKGSEEPERFSILVPKDILAGGAGPRWIASKEMNEAALVKRLRVSRFSQRDISRCLQLARDRFSAERALLRVPTWLSPT